MNASNLVASNINGELIANPMATSPKPIAYYQLGDQSVSTGPTSDYLVPNNSLSDFVFDFDGTITKYDCYIRLSFFSATKESGALVLIKQTGSLLEDLFAPNSVKRSSK